MPQTRPILVTGATGRQGGSGRAVVEALIERGLEVRAMVRRLDDRAEALSALGAQVVVGDFSDRASLVAALDGVVSAYFCYPVAAGITEAAGLFAAAGRATGLERIVDLSLGSAGPDAPSPQVRAQWIAEQIFEWAGFGGVHLRIAAFFMENVALIDGRSVREAGRIANAFGDTPLSFIAGRDVGAMAAGLLADPRLGQDRTIMAGGSESLTYGQIAGVLSEAFGRTVRYEVLSPEAWRAELVAAAQRRGEPNERGADHLVAQARAIKARGGLPVTDHVSRLAGRAPLTFSRFARLRSADFAPGARS